LHPQISTIEPEVAMIGIPSSGGSPFPGEKNQFFFGEFSQQDVTYTVLATNEFNSARKRMSVLVKKGDPNWVVVFLGTGCQRP